MLTFREYAENKGISYEAVRKSVQRYKNELGEHVIRRGKTQFLDDEAIAFLDDKRRENAIVIVNEQRLDEMEALKAENKALMVQLLEAERKLHELEIAQIKAENELRMIEDNKTKILCELEDVHLKNGCLQDEIERLKNRTFLERIFNK